MIQAGDKLPPRLYAIFRPHCFFSYFCVSFLIYDVLNCDILSDSPIFQNIEIGYYCERPLKIK